MSSVYGLPVGSPHGLYVRLDMDLLVGILVFTCEFQVHWAVWLESGSVSSHNYIAAETN